MTGSQNRKREKQLQRIEDEVCLNCGKKPCHYKIPKRFRSHMPEVLRRKRVKGKKVK